MPLLDHFHPPLYPIRPWESFHALWAGELTALLNRLLPPRYFAAVQTHLSSRIEADVAELELTSESPASGPTNGPGGVALQAWAPPTATMTLPAVFPDDIEAQVFDTRDGLRLVAAVELVSPGNLDRPESRRGFAAKCATYLQRGIGLVAADVVTSRRFNLHNELMELLLLPETFAMPADAALYAVAYRPARRQDTNLIDCWTNSLAVGSVLPVLPLALLGGPVVPVDLETTYAEARQRSRL
jgi:hypothetical protein